MPNRCVVGGCTNTADLEAGIALHAIPFADDGRPQARKRRKRWVNFVKLKRAKWAPTKNSRICSKHFVAEDFLRMYSMLPGQDKPVTPRLKKDEVGIAVFPTIQAGASAEPTLTKRSRRMIIKAAIKEYCAANQTKDSGNRVDCTATTSCNPSTSLIPRMAQRDLEGNQPMVEQEDDQQEEQEAVGIKMSELIGNLSKCTQTKGCIGCIKLKNENRQLRNRVIHLREILKKNKKKIKNTK